VTELSYLKSIVLGIVQGATEFLPVSSSAHLAITQRLMVLDGSSDPMLIFDAAAHIGTVIAVGLVFRRAFTAYLIRLRSELRPGFAGRRHALRFCWLGILASIPTAIIGLSFKDWFEASFAKPTHYGSALLLTGVLLATTALVGRGKKGWAKFRPWHAVVIGIAQGCAVTPGISRSGSTICTAALLGLRRRWAGEFSFFIAVPAVLGGAAVQFSKVAKMPAEHLAAVQWGPILLGSVVSMIVGVVCLIWLVHVIRKARLHWFSIYCWILGGLILTGVVDRLGGN
jgi:undecaprenyl-diphosphatase